MLLHVLFHSFGLEIRLLPVMVVVVLLEDACWVRAPASADDLLKDLGENVSVVVVACRHHHETRQRYADHHQKPLVVAHPKEAAFDQHKMM